MDKAGFKEGGIDRNKNNEVGLEENYKPQVWRVYKRKRGKGMKEDELAKRVMRST